MGEIIRCSCENCGYEKDYFVGIGMIPFDEPIAARPLPNRRPYHRKDIFTRVLLGEFGDEAKNAYVNNPGADWEIEESKTGPYPYYCPECRRIYPRRFDDQMTGWVEGQEGPLEVDLVVNCHQCHTRLIGPRHAGKLPEPLICPFCQQQAFSIGFCGCWD